MFHDQGYLALTNCGDGDAVVQRVALTSHGVLPEERCPSSVPFKYQECIVSGSTRARHREVDRQLGPMNTNDEYQREDGLTMQIPNTRG